ncbi:hypothetical protein AK812_SmicGene35614 [Symbiodinium microadriaticum]|uniref:Uncharacterized protein n=1 Tax=Symbiodinium microadriaticum TaxID=2951 RepID=A0A1Q9CL14_SYMMI|nr:hypothetical protein AK812_SmicGene35614 [Symbiodinium microadriaticum]
MLVTFSHLTCTGLPDGWGGSLQTCLQPLDYGDLLFKQAELLTRYPGLSYTLCLNAALLLRADLRTERPHLAELVEGMIADGTNGVGQEIRHTTEGLDGSGHLSPDATAAVAAVANEAGIHSAEVEDLLAVLRRNLHTPDVQAMALKAVHGHLLQKGDRISQGARTRVLTAVLAGVEEHSAHLELQLAASKLLAAGSWSFVWEFGALAIQAFVRISESLPVEAFADVLDSQNADSEPVHWVKAANISRRSPSLQKSLFQHANRLVCRGFGQALANHGAAQLVVEAHICMMMLMLKRMMVLVLVMDKHHKQGAVWIKVLAALARCDLDGIIRAGGLHGCFADAAGSVCAEEAGDLKLDGFVESDNGNEMLMFLSKYEAKQVAREVGGKQIAVIT